MPLLLTLPAESPVLTTAHVPLASLYVIIDSVNYQRKGLAPKRISAQVGYYATEEASLVAERMVFPELPSDFYQDASPEQANELPIFTFLEGLLRAKLEAVLPAGTVIESVT